MLDVVAQTYLDAALAECGASVALMDPATLRETLEQVEAWKTANAWEIAEEIARDCEDAGKGLNTDRAGKLGVDLWRARNGLPAFQWSAEHGEKLWTSAHAMGATDFKVNDSGQVVFDR